jgi:glycerol-3-phosphate acyltransferase PlsY
MVIHLVAPVIALLGGYLVGSLPVAWLLVRRRHGIDLRARGGTGALDALLAAGPRTALMAVLIEALKGGAVALAALLYWQEPWFVALAIAGCVAGDCFPAGFRRGGRGLVPLLSGLMVAFHGATSILVLIAVPVAVLTSMRGRTYETALALGVPAALLLTSHQWLTLGPALLMVAVLVARDRVRKQAALPGVLAPGRRRPLIVEHPAD